MVPRGWQGPRCLGHLPLLFRVHWQGAGLEEEQHPYEMPASQAVAQFAVPQPGPPGEVFVLIRHVTGWACVSQKRNEKEY